MQQILSDKELLVQALEDSGFDQAGIITCCSYFDADNQIALLMQLKEQKEKLLDDLHSQQKQIDCLDYLTYILKQKTRR